MRPSAPNARTSRSPVSASSAAMRSAPVVSASSRPARAAMRAPSHGSANAATANSTPITSASAMLCMPISTTRTGSSRTAPASGTRMRR